MFPRPPQSNLATSPSDLGSWDYPIRRPAQYPRGVTSARPVSMAAAISGLLRYCGYPVWVGIDCNHPLEAASDSQECASSSPELLVAAVSVAHDPGQGLKFAAEQMRIAQVGFSAR